MKRIGFIGLGIMGVPMVRNLCKAGMDVTIIENGHGNKEAIAELKEKGVHTAPTARETARNQDVVITMLPNGRIVKDVLTGPDGVLAGITPGTVLIDSSSVAPAESKQFAALAQEAGCPFLDAPVSGGEPGAIAGTLAFMIGGDERVAGKVRDVFDAMGSSAVVTGPNGAGSVTKLCNQIMCFINIAAVSEALVLAQKAGADPKKVYEAVRGGLAGSAILEQKAARIYSRDFAPGGFLESQMKDINHVMETAQELDVPLLLAPMVQQITESLMQEGRGREDNSCMVTFYEKLAGITVQTKE
jgi:2-hydroxy-3-oxopropionate reductase